MAVIRALTLDGLARRYGVLPTDVLAADAYELFQIRALVRAAEEAMTEEVDG